MAGSGAFTQLGGAREQLPLLRHACCLSRCHPIVLHRRVDVTGHLEEMSAHGE
jgi:hypothetical protein